MTHEVSVAQAVAGSVVLFLGIVLAAAAGIGGGGLNVPILMVSFGFEFKKATRLSLCLVLGNILVQLFLNRKSSHPRDACRPLPYWDLILVLAPAQLIGSSVGIVFRHNIPSTVEEIVAIVVLLFAATKTAIKGLHTRRLENSRPSSFSVPKSISASVDSGMNDFLIARQEATAGPDLRVSEDFESGEVAHPWSSVGALALTWTIYTSLLCAMVFVPMCSAAYVALLITVFVPLSVHVLWALRFVQRAQSCNASRRLEGDLDWQKNSYFYIVIAIVIGILTAMLGIGGGELMGPLMLLMGVLPQVAAGTTPVLSFIASGSNVIQFAVRGEIPFAYGAWMASIGVVGGYIGRRIAISISKTMKRPSFTVFCLSAVLYVGMVLLIYILAEEGVDMGVESFCDL